MEEVSANRCFGGVQRVYTHRAESLGCEMRFGAYLPPQAADGPCPVVYWLSGLTCTEQNFVTKAGAQQHAAEHGVIVIAPDTSPRGAGVPGEDDDWDLGTGAGFYVNATQKPWAASYRMFEYVTAELPALVERELPVRDGARSVMGHSMGGHGALVAALRCPGRYRAVSAFSPIVAPSRVPWGHKAFGAYLGEDRDAWLEWDACALIPDAAERLPILVHQGAADPFLERELKPELLARACEAAGHPLDLRVEPGYDHSYFFIATFLGEHFAWHAAALAG